MKHPRAYFLKVGLILIGAGSLAGGFGVSGFIRFLRVVSDPWSLSLRQLALQLILPHALMLVGLGTCLYGVILVARAISFVIVARRRARRTQL